VYDPKVVRRFIDDTRDLGIPVLLGLLPLASYRNAEFLHNEVPGMTIPDEVRRRMEKVGGGAEGRAEGIRIAREMLEEFKEEIVGAYIVPPFSRYESALRVLEPVGYAAPPPEKASSKKSSPKKSSPRRKSAGKSA
jgi:homocysteine S-methyltransferase